jgi:hypothetical protein
MGFGVRYDVEQSIGFNRKHDLLEGHIPLNFQLFILSVVPTKRLHASSLAGRVPNVITGLGWLKAGLFERPTLVQSKVAKLKSIHQPALIASAEHIS